MIVRLYCLGAQIEISTVIIADQKIFYVCEYISLTQQKTANDLLTKNQV